MRKLRGICVDKLKALSLLIVTVGVSLCFACGGNAGSSGDEPLDESFLNGVAAAQAAGLPVYWLGRGFPVQNLTFYGPYGGDTGEGGQLGTNYIAPLGDNPDIARSPNAGLLLTTYSRTAWGPVADWLMTPTSIGVKRWTVTVGGRNATMIMEPGTRTRPVNAVWLVLEMDGFVVLADAHSGGPASPGGPDSNPFVNDPDLLVQVMQNLRPYPE
jgi:hypothetical protein